MNLKNAVSSNLTLFSGVLVVGVFVIIASSSWFFLPYPVTELNISVRLQGFSALHLLGTDHYGRDVLSMLMRGAYNSLFISLSAVLFGASVGVLLGLLASTRELKWALVLNLADFLFAMPALLTATLFAALFGASAFNAILAIGLFNIPVFLKLTYAAALPVWHSEYVLAACALGKSKTKIALQHILLSSLPLLWVHLATQCGVAIIAEAGLSYLGLSTPAPEVSWGRMLFDAQTFLHLAPHTVFLPGGVIVISVLGFNLLGEGLRSLLDLPNA